MRALLHMLVCLTLLFTGWASTAQAGENHAPMAASALALHVAGDGDEHPADQHSNLPHHHNICHGHDVAYPVALSAKLRTADDRGEAVFAVNHLREATPSELLPRPPKA